jgi:hypothetical protein
MTDLFLLWKYLHWTDLLQALVAGISLEADLGMCCKGIQCDLHADLYDTLSRSLTHNEAASSVLHSERLQHAAMVILLLRLHSWHTECEMSTRCGR